MPRLPRAAPALDDDVGPALSTQTLGTGRVSKNREGIVDPGADLPCWPQQPALGPSVPAAGFTSAWSTIPLALRLGLLSRAKRSRQPGVSGCLSSVRGGGSHRQNGGSRSPPLAAHRCQPQGGPAPRLIDPIWLLSAEANLRPTPYRRDGQVVIQRTQVSVTSAGIAKSPLSRPKNTITG